MIGKTEREDRKYAIQLRQIVTYAFIKARGCESRCISLQKLYGRFCRLNQSDIVSYMSEPLMREIFKREITGSGIVYRLTGKFRYVEYDVVNKFVNKELLRLKEERKKN